MGMTPEEALNTIDRLEKFGMRLGLERITSCLDVLGRPQSAYPTVHVGGTNGKGSTCLLISRVLSETGRRVGLYTSPPLESFGERIRIDGRPLPDTAVPSLLEAVLSTRAARPDLAEMTQFEVITAIALLHFAREGVDAAVVEVGLGGRLDSTNVIVPLVAAVTNVGLEHAEHLGPTVAAIAGEKAGIAKPGVPLVTGADGEALEALKAHAAKIGAPVYALGRDFSVRAEGPGVWSYRGRLWALDGLALGLLGAHQGLNLAAALAVLETLGEKGWEIPESAVRQGAAGASWPGRLEVLEKAGAGARVVLDGAHNPHASRVLAEALRVDLPHRKLTLILGILGDKDARSILADLLPLADEVIFTRSASKRALDPEELALLGRELAGVPAQVSASVAEAVEEAVAVAAEGELICVTGSLTTVGEARTRLRSMGWVR